MLGMYAGLFFLLLCLMGATLYAYQLRCEYTSAHEELTAVVRGSAEAEQVIRNLGGEQEAGRKLQVYMTYTDDTGELNAACYVLRSMGKEAVPALLAGLKSSSTRKKLYAAQALKDLATDAASAAPDLLTALTDSSKEVRVAALAALRATRAPLPTERIVECLRDGEPLVRASAARCLGTLGTSEARSALLRLIADQGEDIAVRQAAREALEKIKKVQEKDKDGKQPAEAPEK